MLKITTDPGPEPPGLGRLLWLVLGVLAGGLAILVLRRILTRR